MLKPVVFDFFCGLGGWTHGFLAEGYDCYGFDVERHQYGEKRYPAQLILQDVLTLHGSQFKDAACLVASPPCQRYSYMAMPFSRGKREAAAIRADKSGVTIAYVNALFDACFRIQREASQAAGREIPMVVENVKGAQPWVGRAAWHYGSYYLWGDVPALMPRALSAVKVPSSEGRRTDVGNGVRFTSRDCGVEGVKQAGLSGPAWFDGGAAAVSSSSPTRKAASAQIAEIPFDLAQWIARCFKP